VESRVIETVGKVPIYNDAQRTQQPSSSSCTEHVKVILIQEPKKDERVILSLFFKNKIKHFQILEKGFPLQPTKQDLRTS